MKTKHFTIPAILLAVIMAACNTSAQKSSNESNNSDTLVQSESPKEEPAAPQVNYNDFPVAYVKNSVLYFFNPENETTVQFTEETDSVFNCVYSDRDAMFYYSVSRNGMLSFKKVDLSTTPVQPQLIIDLNKPAQEFFSQTNYDKANLKFLENNLLLEYDFIWDFYSFTKLINISLKDNSTSIIDWDQFEQKYGYHPRSNEKPTKNYNSIYKKAMQLDLSKYKFEGEDEDFETECFFKGASADGSKIVFSIMLGMGDLAHGPNCVANADGTMIKLLQDTDMSDELKPLWCNNNLLYYRSYDAKTEDENEIAKRINELCYTRATDNTPVLIDQDVDYFAVRNKHPVN